MALIRQSDKSTPLADAIVYRLGDLVREGTALREQTTRQVETMVAEARAERERLISGAREEGLALGREEGYKAGFAKGIEEGRAQSLAQFSEQLTSLLAGWTRSLENFEKDRDSLLLEARTEVLRLAVEIGRAVVKREIALHPGAVVDQADAALKMVVRPSRIRLAVHPDDRPIIEAALPGLLARCFNATHIECGDDSSLDRGSCIVRTAGGEIDAGVRVQLERIAEAIVPAASPGAGIAAEGNTAIMPRPTSPGSGDSPESPA
ncbi:MAG: FliH/SctL family protein [Phycisphaerales bacterium]